MTEKPDKRSAAAALADDLLTDSELQRLAPSDFIRKASRLARLLDDDDALAWLSHEITGYASGTVLDVGAAAAATRSGRSFVDDKGVRRFRVTSIAKNQSIIDSAKTRLSVNSENAFAGERSQLQLMMAESADMVDRVLGAVHMYVAERHAELRFGNAVEGAFGRVRSAVDRQIGELVPLGLSKLSAAFENVDSANPEDWANAASTCRRLLKDVADAIRPPGPDVDGRKMGKDQYINRLIDWIGSQSNTAGTTREFIVADLQYLGRRLDASATAGHKGAHTEVSQYDAARYVTGTYLTVGDILALRPQAEAPLT